MACGRGRGAVYLAGLGFAVDALDVSPVAVDDLSRRAAEDGLKIRARAVDLTDLSSLDEVLPPATYDLIVVFRYLDRALVPYLERALRSGGYLVFETFVAVAGAVTDFNPAYMLRPGELGELFPHLETELFEDGGDDGRAVSRLLARRR